MSNPFSKEQKSFSLCVPTYKDKYKYFDRFFTTLNEQEYKSFQTIIVFDGPSKRGVKQLEKTIKKFPELDISFYIQKHAGCCAARNTAASHAKGDYLAFPSPDCWLYPQTLRIWANAFEEHPEVNRVWGLYNIENSDGTVSHPIGQVPLKQDNSVWYGAFKYSPFCDATFPIRKEAFIEWDINCISLNDWEYSVRLLAPTFEGKDWLYLNQEFFLAETPVQGGLSFDSHNNWQDRKKYIMDKNGVDGSDICVTSLGAPHHGIHASEKLKAEYLPMPSFKPHDYKLVYLLGFYTREDPKNPYVTKTHMDVFERNKGKNIIHWIGTDILDLYWHDSFMKLKTLRKWFKEKNVIHLCEAEFTQKELKEIGIDAKIVPLPPDKLYEPMDLPEQFSVGVYLPGRDIYREDLIMKVVRALPDVEFYFFGDEERKKEHGDNWRHLGYIDYDQWMPNLSCNLRITMHDGLPLTPLQFLTAGRNVVTNTPVKGAIIVTEELDSIVNGIRKAQETPLNLKWSKYWNKELSTEKFIKRIMGLV